MAAAREWLDVAEEIQRQVVLEFRLPEKEGLKLLRSAVHRFPELRQIAVYARSNLARNGTLVKGDLCPDVELLRMGDGNAEHPQPVHLHSLAAEVAVATVLCVGSYS